MTLTSVLADPHSPLTRYLTEHLPDLAALRADYRRRLGRPDVVRPQPPAGTRAAHGTLGAAVDHRLRLALRDDEPFPATASTGVAIAARLSTPGTAAALTRAGTDLAQTLADLVARHSPADRSHGVRIDDDADEALARACVVTAWFEEVYRKPTLWPGTPLGDATPSTTLDDLLDAVPGYAVADLTEMVALAETGLGELRATTPPDDVRLGPTFAGSDDVSGADADWIAGDLLVDVKATAKPDTLDRTMILQLVGYLLLDYDDEYRIGRVGWYQARAGRLISWPVEEFLRLLGATAPLSRLRRDVEGVLLG
ncbi:MAG: hypothetical protein U0Q15_06875 [Kineosporiaceae bacterium]